MSELPRPAFVLILVGLPVRVKAVVEADLRSRATVRSVTMKQDGGYLLSAPGREAARLVVQFADEAAAYEQVAIVTLPYTRLPQEVQDAVQTLASLGAALREPRSNSGAWPSQPDRMDETFFSQLRAAIRAEVDALLPAAPPAAGEDREIIVDILRGLISHSKMGPNNHSSEDDLWKSRGAHLRPGGRSQIMHRLRAEGILGRKKNASVGGTGWVYWIADVAKVRTKYPELQGYFVEGDR